MCVCVCVLLATSVNSQGNFTNPLLDLEKGSKREYVKTLALRLAMPIMIIMLIMLIMVVRDSRERDGWGSTAVFLSTSCNHRTM